MEMEGVYDMIELEEDTRIDLRILLVGITPSMLAQIGSYESIRKLKDLNVPAVLALVIANFAVFYEEGKSSLLITYVTNSQL